MVIGGQSTQQFIPFFKRGTSLAGGEINGIFRRVLGVQYYIPSRPSTLSTTPPKFVHLQLSRHVLTDYCVHLVTSNVIL
jgi:hypothetical protein